MELLSANESLYLVSAALMLSEGVDFWDRDLACNLSKQIGLGLQPPGGLLPRTDADDIALVDQENAIHLAAAERLKGLGFYVLLLAYRSSERFHILVPTLAVTRPVS
jgi:hypothetical protein